MLYFFITFYNIINDIFPQTLTSQSNSLGILLSKALSLAVNMAKYKPFISVTADQLAFGYDDALVSLAHTFYPRHKRPMDRMGLLIGVCMQ